MDKDQDSLIDLMQDQGDFGFPKDGDYPVEFVCTTREGHGLYRRQEPHGGWSYWSDEVPPALLVYDQGLTNVMTLFEALDHLGEGEILWKHIGTAFGYDKD